MDSIKNDEFELRKCCVEDKDLLYRWANDPYVRANAFNCSPIPYDDHEKWFAETLTSNSRVQLILERFGVPVGQIRLDIVNGIGEIDYSIASEYRGCGFGTVICHMLNLYVKKYLKINKLIAQVKVGNEASKRCFIKNGFGISYEQFELDMNEDK